MKLLPLKFALTILAYAIAVAASVWLMATAVPSLQVIGVLLISGLIVCWLTLPILDARNMERHVDQNPHLLKNNAIGEVVTAVAEFEWRDGTAKGVVMLNGEKWRARCMAGLVPGAGERLRVSGRDGLTLHVRPVESSR
jgi:membrane protein implicated in regulation of membrane protease activity